MKPGIVGTALVAVVLCFAQAAATKETTTEQTLVSVGAYRYIRHPIYAGFLPSLRCCSSIIGLQVGLA